MTIFDTINLFGGVGLFLYGMNLLGSSIQKFAGSKLETTLEKLTNSKLKAVLLGLGVTAVIQSSSATSIMVVGFVNAGIMKLSQGVSVMIGANIGTTVTGQILRLGDISDSATLLTLIKPATFAPICVALGAAVRIIAKRERPKNLANIIIGFGILFIGMSIIEAATEPLGSSEKFKALFSIFENPFAGLLLGVIVTTITQSASASVGILQAISATGQITFSIAAPIVLGMNIGKFIPVIMASVGTNKKAKRALAANVIICISGALLFIICMYAYQAFVGFTFWKHDMSRGNIADFNTIFNIGTTILLFPFCDKIIALSGVIIRGDADSKIDTELARLDNNFIKTPGVAIEQSHKLIISMGETARDNLALSIDLLDEYDISKRAQLDENELFLDKCESVLGEYLVKITANGLTRENTRRVTEIMHALGDFERIGDYCVNIAEVGEYNHDHHIVFSETGKYELKYMMRAVSEILDITIEAFAKADVEIARRVEPLEETIDGIVELLKEKHVDRLQSGECDIPRGISFVELLNNVERISDHCSVVAIHVMQRMSQDDVFDAHAEINSMHAGNMQEYNRLYEHYNSLYRDPLR